MAPVADNLATVPDADVRAIAAYVAAQIGRPSPDRERQGDELVARVADRADAPGARPQSAGSQTVAAQPGGNEGAAIYAGACATCHDAGRPVPYGGLNLALSTAVSADTPRNFVNVVLGGVAPAEGKRGPIMPPFAATLSDDRIVALSNKVRRRFAHKSAWPDLAPEIAAARQTVTVEGVGSAAIAPDDSQTK